MVSNQTKRERRERDRAAREAKARADARRRRLRTALIASGAVAGVVAAAAVYWFVIRDDRPVIAPDGVTADGGIAVSTAAGAGADGESGESGGVPVVVYEDFHCIHCADLAGEAGEWMETEARAGTIDLEYRPIAFLSDFSTQAAEAAACTLDEGGTDAFLAFQTEVYADYSDAGLSDDELVAHGETAGVDIGACLESGRFEPWVADVTDAAEDARTQGTPYVLVDGERLETPSLGAVQDAVSAATA